MDEMKLVDMIMSAARRYGIEPKVTIRRDPLVARCWLYSDGTKYQTTVTADNSRLRHDIRNSMETLSTVAQEPVPDRY